MPKKTSITLSWPIRWKRIANGERIIEQTGPDEIEVDVREGEIKGESWLQELNRFLNEAERELRTSRCRKGQGVVDFDSRRSHKRWDQKTTEGNKASR